MNIGMISYWSSPLARVGVWEAGGMNVYISGLATALTGLGHRVDIFTRSYPGEKNKITKVGPYLRVIHFPARNKDLYSNLSPFSQNILEFTKREKISYDILHSHYYYSALIASELKSFHIPLVHNFHSYGILKSKHLGITDAKRLASEKRICSFADAILTSTPIEKKDVIQFYSADEGKVFVISPGINHNVFRPYNKEFSRKKLNLATGKIYILFVGRIDPVKGIPVLIKAVSQILQRDVSLRERMEVLLIGGDISSRKFWMQEEVKIITKSIKKKNLEKNVRFMGSRSNNILPYYYSASDIVVLPSSFESFGLVILEAMACKACIVASKAGGPEYLIRDGRTGFLFDRENAGQFGDILYDLILNPKKRAESGKNAMGRSMDFCWSSQAEKIVELYKKIIQKYST